MEPQADTDENQADSYIVPKIYRAMISEAGKPAVGSDRNRIGVRVPPGEKVDVTPDNTGSVSPGGGGMSVNPTLSTMMMVHIPRRWRKLDSKFKSARGEEPVEVFTLGAGPFASSKITDDLLLTPDSTRHGVVEPVRTMPLKDYQEALAATREDWQILLEPDGS